MYSNPCLVTARLLECWSSNLKERTEKNPQDGFEGKQITSNKVEAGLADLWIYSVH